MVMTMSHTRAVDLESARGGGVVSGLANERFSIVHAHESDGVRFLGFGNNNIIIIIGGGFLFTLSVLAVPIGGHHWLQA
jgi:hypothetical protein